MSPERSVVPCRSVPDLSPKRCCFMAWENRSDVMPLPRRIEPEWLDELPAGDRRAMRSRRDLRRVNRWMLQARIMARLMADACGDQPPHTLLELGAGDGTFMLSVARRLARHWRGTKVLLLDRQNIVTDKTRESFSALDWSA